ncbi:hypothetical protein R6Q57_005530 [Mikania cordata]
MPRINTSVDDLALQSDHAYEFPTKPVLLTVDPIVSDVSNASEVCAEKLSVSGSEEKEGERSAGRSTDCSTSTSPLSFVPKTDFVEKFDEIKIKPNDMLKSFEKTFAINRVSKLTSSHLTKQAAPAYSTVTKEAGSQLNPNYEPYMADLRFVSDHNLSAYLGDPPEKHSEFKSMVDGLILSPVNYAIMEHPTIVSDFIEGFWITVTEHTDANGTVSIIGKIQGQPIIIIKQIMRECLQFGDKAEDPVELDQGLVNRTVYQMGHEVAYPPTEKKLLHPYWRYLAHIVTQCLSGRKKGYDVLNQTLSSCLVALSLGMDFNYSKMIFLDMHSNIKGRRKERFLAFPHFLQIVINKRHPALVPTMGTLGIKRMRDEIFGYMKMNERGKKQYTGERPLIKFGRFVGDNVDEDMPGTSVAIVAEKHDVQATSTKADEAAKDNIPESSSSSSEDFVAEKASSDHRRKRGSTGYRFHSHTRVVTEKKKPEDDVQTD